MSLIRSVDDADRALACMGRMIQHNHFEVPALQLSNLFTKVLVRRDEDNQVLRPVVGVVLQHVHEAVCSLQAAIGSLLPVQHQMLCAAAAMGSR